MGQNSSVAVGTTKLMPEDKRNIIVDASDSCVSGVKLRSTGIIPISELIKQETCSKNIQKIEKNYYNRKKNVTKQPNEKFKSKKAKAEFIETSFEDVPAKRQWVRINPEPKNAFECDAAKIGLKKPSSKTVLNNNEIYVPNGFRDYDRACSSEHNPENSRHTKRENIRGNSQNVSANRETKKVDVREDTRPSTRKRIGKNIGVGTQEFNNKDISRKSIRKTEKKKTVAEKAKKSNLKNNATEHKFKESSTQTISRDKAILYENVKQLYKRNHSDEKKRIRNNYQDDGRELHENTKIEANKIKQQYQPQLQLQLQQQQQQQHQHQHQQQQQQQKQYKHHKTQRTSKDLDEESTHQIQLHEISHPKQKSRKYRQHLTIKTAMLCSISPEKYLQCQTNSNENKLGRCAGRNYINRKVAGEYYSGDEKYAPCYNDINSFDSSDMLESSVSLLPSASTLEQAIKEHKKYVSAKEALESWKNLHTWKQHRKQFERSRNQFYQDNFDVATQTMFVRPKSMVRKNRSNHYMQTYPVMHDDMIVPSEKYLYKDFIVKMEHCLQKHSRLCEQNAKRNGEAKYTWVQDKYRRWHKITFDDYKN